MQSLFINILVSGKLKAVCWEKDSSQSTSKDKSENELFLVENGEDHRSDKSIWKSRNKSVHLLIKEQFRLWMMSGFELSDILKTGFETADIIVAFGKQYLGGRGEKCFF